LIASCSTCGTAPIPRQYAALRGTALHHHEVLPDEDQQVQARSRDLALDARQGRGQGLPQRRALNPKAFRRKPLPEEQIFASPMLNYSLTQYMFCSPDEGAAAVVLCRAEHARRYYSDKPIYLRATTVRARQLGAFEVHSAWPAARRPPAYATRRSEGRSHRGWAIQGSARHTRTRQGSLTTNPRAGSPLGRGSCG
jgi:hypothetical protein